MNKKELSAGTNDEQRTTADSIPSASLEQNGVLSAALSIEEGNKLIAKFMDEYDLYHWGRDPFNEFLKASYHSSWDKLMPAVNKFINENIRPVESRETNEYRNYVNRLYNLVTDFNITNVFNCLVEAIKWLMSVGSR